MADWFRPCIIKQEPGHGDDRYEFPLAITGFQMAHGVDQKLVKRPRVDGESVHGTSKGILKITITGEFQGIYPADVVDELNAMRVAARGVAVQDNEVRVFSHYNAIGASSVCIWYERCRYAGLTYDNFSRRQYRSHLWVPWTIKFIALDPEIYREGEWSGSDPPTAASPTAADPNNITGTVVIKGSLIVKNATSGLIKFKADQSGNVQAVGAITQPASIS